MRCPSGRHCASLVRAIVVLSALVLSGCSSGSSLSGSSPNLLEKMFAMAPSDGEAEKVAEKKSACGTPAQCRSALKAMVESPKRPWVGQQMPPDAYADGTRLFAYRALRKRLKCDELARAIDEMRGVSKSLNGTVSGISSEQAARTRALNVQVEGELVRERTARCRA